HGGDLPVTAGSILVGILPGVRIPPSPVTISTANTAGPGGSSGGNSGNMSFAGTTITLGGNARSRGIANLVATANNGFQAGNITLNASQKAGVGAATPALVNLTSSTVGITLNAASI